MSSSEEGQRAPLLVLGLASFSSLASMRVCDAILPMLASEFRVTTGTAAQTISAFAVAYGALQLFYGPVGDRLGRARVMAWALLCCAAANVALVTASTLESAVLWRLVAGAASGGIVPLSLAWIGDSVAYERRQEMLSRLMIATILGMISGQWLGGLLAEIVGWRTVFVALAGLFGVAGWLVFREAAVDRSRRSAVSAIAPLSLEAFVQPMVRVVQGSWARRVLATVFIEGALAFAAFSFVPSYLHDRFGLSLGQAGAVVALYGLGGLCFAAIARRAIPRMGERGLVLSGGAALGVALALLALAPAWYVTAPACWLGGLGFYMLHSTLQAHATQMAPEVRGTAVSLFVVFLFLGQSLGVLAASAAVDQGGVRWVFGAAALGLPAVAVWFAAQLRHRR